MRFAVIGAGAIGGLLGARLSLAGEAVTFVARNRNLETIAANGFRLIDEHGVEHHAKDATAVADAASIGPQDAVLLTVKAHQVKDVLPALAVLVGPATTLVTMINGLPWWYFQRHGGAHEGRSLDSVDPGGTLATAIDPARIVGGIVYPAAELVAPGVVRHIEGHRFSIGEPDGSRSERIVAVAEALMRAGFKAPVTKDIRHEIWVKLWGNLSFNPVSALTHATLESICDDAGGRGAVEAMMREAAAVATALGIGFRISLEQRIAGARAIGAHKTSMLQDVEAGRALEIEALLGSVVELGRIVGVATPALDLVCGLVRLLEKTLAGGGAVAAADGGLMLIVAATAVALLGFAALLSSIQALGAGRPLAFVLRAAFGVAVTAAGAAGLVVAAGLEGVRALTHEEVAATIRLRPTGPQSVDATVTLADGRSQTYSIAGDEIYVDAHILKWSPRLNVLGLHTSYRLDRIGGRYRSLAQEATGRRTIHALRPAAAIDLVALRQRMPLPMAPLLDAEYGSATFVPFEPGAAGSVLEVRVSTSGLLMRPAAATKPSPN